MDVRKIAAASAAMAVVLTGCGGASCDAEALAKCGTDWSTKVSSLTDITTDPGKKQYCEALAAYGVCITEGVGGCPDETQKAMEQGLKAAQEGAKDICNPETPAEQTQVV